MYHFNVNELDMRLFVASSLRYACGRHTYMPHFVIGFVEENLEHFGDESLRIFAGELEEYRQSYSGADAADRENIAFAKTVEAQIWEKLNA